MRAVKARQIRKKVMDAFDSKRFDVKKIYRRAKKVYTMHGVLP